MSEAGSGDIQLNEDMSFQRRQWRVERVAWLVGALILVLALAGFAGRGPVASTERSDADGLLTLAYDRIERRDSPTTIEMTVANPDRSSDVTILLSGHLMHGIQISQIQPEPRSMVAGDDTIELIVDVAPGAESVRIAMTIVHEAIGREQSTIGLVGGPEVEFDQWVLP